ncbi:MOSC domain-containing protein [Salipaludibacillus agaradhaerens]|uniref:MOSC domain-containing protein n=1 Tax=Salipaludibacillus agaradhaerens TaxID=76935 RepID=UPI0021512C67|nr:MOSC domain-containing protein [Salipaludibacillus agaradhaerens]MCR6105821.1 MOSC domain-containing protein [Salipaludibacillus agaradhaerens]MCR6117856.1 MOSC domain-containing protein [Salipaludibacillus agaradhaerens]
MVKEGLSIMALNIGKPQTLTGLGQTVISGIVKRPVDEEIYLSQEQLTGDGQADLVHHGGPDKAVCVYSYDHYPYWEKHLDNTISYGAFGENLTITRGTEQEIHIGDTFKWGEAIVQVSQPRMPCHKLAKKFEVPDLPKRVIETGFSGYYLRVLKEGTVSVKEPLIFQERHTTFSIAMVNDVYYKRCKDKMVIEQVSEDPYLATSWRKMLTNNKK